MGGSRSTVQDARMRSPAAAEDLQCHCNELPVLPALQHLFQSAELGSGYKKKNTCAESWRFNFLPLREMEGAGSLLPFC